MTAQKVEESCWSQYLAPQLTGKAQLAFAALPGEDSGNYDAIKAAILQRYDITEEAYRRRFSGITSKYLPALCPSPRPPPPLVSLVLYLLEKKEG